MQQPNIILVNCDDLGYGDLGCYGSVHHQTPAIDRMAAQGVRFTDFYMASPVCSASRAAMLTGCYPRRIGFPGVLHPASAVGLHPDEITIARLLQQAGYATQLVGKWHCGDQPPFLPTRHGFDHYYGLPYSNDMGRNRGAGDAVPPLPLIDGTEVIQQQPEQGGLTERYMEQSLRFIRRHARQPFFLYLAHKYVHVPIYVQEHFLARSGNGLYGAAVACLDWSMQLLLSELADLGLDEKTLVIFTSDNGARWTSVNGNAPLRGCKNTTWEGGLRVPCIMRWPGRIPQGTTCTSLATAMDFYPTLAALGSATVPTDRVIDGRDIRPLMLEPDSARSPHEVFFYYQGDALEAVRDDRWKLHVAKRGDAAAMPALFDLRADVGETRNLYTDHPEVVSRLEAHLERCREDLGDARTGQPGTRIRPVGRVEHPVPLTHFDPDHPCMIEEYDLKDERA